MVGDGWYRVVPFMWTLTLVVDGRGRLFGYSVDTEYFATASYVVTAFGLKAGFFFFFFSLSPSHTLLNRCSLV